MTHVLTDLIRACQAHSAALAVLASIPQDCDEAPHCRECIKLTEAQIHDALRQIGGSDHWSDGLMAVACALVGAQLPVTGWQEVPA
jgi:hypothetical protein